MNKTCTEGSNRPYRVCARAAARGGRAPRLQQFCRLTGA